MSKIAVLKLKNFTISYEPTYYRSRTIRDFFVETIQNPIKYFSSKKDRLVVLRDINLEIVKGDILAILGANGVGKTSLCRYLSGIIQTKDVEIYGETRAIFENNTILYPDLTGRENAIVLTELLYENLDFLERKEIVEEAITFSELKEFIDVPFKNYSRGMKARLYLSLLTSKPVDLLVLDEAFGGTDHFFAEKLHGRIKDLMKKCGAVILVSHNFDEVLKYCNRAIVLKNKEIAFDGRPDLAIEFYNSGDTKK